MFAGYRRWIVPIRPALLLGAASAWLMMGGWGAPAAAQDSTVMESLDDRPGAEMRDSLFPLDPKITEPFLAGQKASDAFFQALDQRQQDEAAKAYSVAMEKLSESINVARQLGSEERLWSPYFVRGRILAAAGQHAAAIGDFNVVIRRNSRFGEAYYRLAQSYIALGELPSAIEAISRAINYGRQSALLVNYYFTRGQLYSQTEAYEKASEDFLQAISQRPGVPQFYYQAGYAFLELGEQEQAEGDLSAPERFQTAQRLLQKAIDVQRAVAETPPAEPTTGVTGAYFDMGRAQAALGQYEEAVQNMQIAIDQDPDNLEYLDRLAKLRLTRANQTEAVNLRQSPKLKAEAAEDYRRAITLLSQMIEVRDKMEAEGPPAAAPRATNPFTDDAAPAGAAPEAVPAVPEAVPAAPAAPAAEPAESEDPADADTDSDTETDADTGPSLDLDDLLGGVDEEPADAATDDGATDAPADAATPTETPAPTEPAAGAVERVPDFEDLGPGGEAAAGEPGRPPVDLDPAEAYLLRAVASLQLATLTANGDVDDLYRSAIRDSEKVIELNPQSPAAFFNVGLANRMLGNYEAAIAGFSEAIKLSPNYADAYLRRGIVWYHLGEYELALDDFNDVTAITRDSRGYHWAGITYATLGDFSEAITAYSEAVRISPNNGRLYGNRALAYIRQEQYERALEDLTELLRRDRANPETHFRRGVVFEKLEQPHRALTSYEEALRFDPSHAAARRRLAALRGQRGR